MDTNATNSTMSGEVNPFSVVDYVVFTAMLVASLATGLYHAFSGHGQNTTASYLLADRQMTSLPIALSTVVSFLSAITLLGLPAEIYTHGVQYWWTSFSFVLKLSITAIIFIPVYYGLGLTSAYEYLDLRFGIVVRIAGTILFIIQTEFYMAIVLYAPALAIQAVTSLPIYLTILLSSVVCTVYTTLGGIKGVIWADVFQFVVLLVSFVVVVVLGTIKAGGIEYVWNYNGERGHLNFFVLSPDPTVRLTLWGATVGAGFNGLTQYAVSQIAVQRFLTAKSLKAAQMSLLWGIPSAWFMVTLVSMTGLVLFTYYNNEDTGSGEPNYSKIDQILIYFVSQEFGKIPGIQGLFIASLYAGTISTITSGLNSLAAVALTDIIKPWRRWSASRLDLEEETSLAQQAGETTEQEQDKRDTRLSKIMTVVFGVITLGLAFVSSKMGTLVQMTNTVMGALGGPIVGLFSLGMLYKRSNGGGALSGLVMGAAIGIWMAIGSLSNTDAAFWLYRVSFMWYSFLSFLVTFVVGVAVSELIRLWSEEERMREINPSLLAPFLRPKGFQQAAEAYEMELRTTKKKASTESEERGVQTVDDDDDDNVVVTGYGKLEDNFDPDTQAAGSIHD